MWPPPLRAALVFITTVAAADYHVTVAAAVKNAAQLPYAMVDPVFTAYFPNGTINYGVIPAYAELCVKSGVDTVLLGGSTAEWPYVTRDS